jgi:hypothetical protein
MATDLDHLAPSDKRMRMQVIADQTTRSGSRNLELRRHRRVASHETLR